MRRAGWTRFWMCTRLILLALSLSVAVSADPLLRLEKSADAMGSTYSIALYGYDRVEMEAAADAAFDEVAAARRHAFELQARKRMERGQPARGAKSR